MSQKHWQSNEFNVSHEKATALTDHSLKAAPGSGWSYYITDIECIEGGTSRLNTLHNATTAADANTVWRGAPVANTNLSCHFNIPIKVGDNLPILLTTAGTSTGGFIVVNGFVGRS